MATVFLARDLKHDRDVALKVLKPELGLAVGPDRFLREIAIAARLTHPNILPLHDSGEATGLLYYVMPYLAGESLRDRLTRERRLPLEEALRITREVADALAYAHGEGLIHRDIKPENILFQAGHAVVSDFGIARAVSAAGSDRLTETGLAVGTPAYMSPEQALGGSTLDARSDVYSLGCMLFEMLSGVTPFRGPTPQAIVAAHATRPVPPLSTLGVSVPAGLEVAIGIALAKDPAKRHPGAQAFAEALTLPASLSAAIRRQIRSHGTASFILTIFAAGGLAWLAWRQAPSGDNARITSLAVLPFANESGDAGQNFFVGGVHEALIDEFSHVSALRVVPRRSTLAYEGTRKSIPEIASDLHVDGLIEGSVVRSGDSVRIAVRLIRARPEERQLWSESFNRDVRHVLDAYSDVARAVADRIGIPLTRAESERLTTRPEVDPVAYELTLKGRFQWYKLTPEGIDAAEQYFQLALRQAPGYAPAHAGISNVWVSRLQMGLSPPAVAAPKAREAAGRSLALDSTLVEGHHNLALIAMQTDWDWNTAEAEFKHTLALNPHYADARAFYSHLLNVLGRPADARREMDRALALDPLNPLFLSLNAVDLFFERRWRDAEAQAVRALSTTPGQPVALYALWLAYDAQHRDSAAAGAAAEYLRAVAQPVAAAAVAQTFPRAGYRAAMRQAADTLSAMSKAGYVAPFDVAMLYTAAGETERAAGWLETAYAARDPSMPYLGLPSFDPLRSVPRFQALFQRMNLSR
jgi:eukaryotic-like serine/threonine-protein kinase